MRATGNGVGALHLDVPEGWESVRLDDVAERATGHTPDKNVASYWDGGIKWVSLADSNKLNRPLISATDKEISDDGIRNSSARLLPGGTVVLLRDAGVGRSSILATDMAVSQHFVAWICGERISNRFLYYYLQSRKVYFERMAVGSTIVTIGMGLFRKLMVPLPPKVEQNKIAALLALWDRTIDLTDSLIIEKRLRCKWLMQQLLTGKRRLSGFAGKWREHKLGEFLAESREQGSDGATARKITIKLYTKGVLPKEEKTAGSKSTKYFVRSKGQFIYSKLDFLNGAFGIIPDNLDGYESTLDLPAFDVTAGLNVRWLLYFVSREEFYSQQLGLANGGRKARRVNPKAFLSCKVRMPEREEQDRIVAVLMLADRELDLLQAKADALSKQKKGLMQQLLTGKKRVKG